MGGGGSSWASAVPLLLSLCFKQKTFKVTFLVFFLDSSKKENVFISVEFFPAALFSLQCGATLEMFIYLKKETTGLLNCVLNLLFKINQSLWQKELQARDDLEVRAGQGCPEKIELNSVPQGLSVSHQTTTLQVHFHKKTLFTKKRE